MILAPEHHALLERLHDYYVRYGKGNLPNQLIKIQEELGEAAEAYIGWVGTNPRKGVTHTKHDVAMELADVVITALLGIRYTELPIEDILAQQAAKTINRLNEFDEEVRYDGANR